MPHQPIKFVTIVDSLPRDLINSLQGVHSTLLKADNKIFVEDEFDGQSMHFPR